ncbi:MAG: folate family ECF transporter S component [Ruminococcaceae bacterium]|nr:folate family ECF transporter S component [Oscillospiraceae bacterium]
MYDDDEQSRDSALSASGRGVACRTKDHSTMLSPHPLLHTGHSPLCSNDTRSGKDETGCFVVLPIPDLELPALIARGGIFLRIRQPSKEESIMSNKNRPATLYKHPFSRGYWRDAASELSNTRMLVIAALLTAMRIALKPLAIPLAANLSIQTATLATALGAMIYGPVIAIPAAIISDTIGFIIWPTGDYFLPFMLTEIAGTMIYALFLYRSKVSTTRVMLARFGICLLVNVVLQQFIYAWYYAYIGQPESAINSIMGIMTTTRIFKNLVCFPIETVVLTLFLKALLPVTQKFSLTFCPDADLRFSTKQVVAMVLLIAVGLTGTMFYLNDRYNTTSRSSDYSDAQRMEANKAATAVVEDQDKSFSNETLVCIVDSAYRGLFDKDTEYTVSIYILNKEAFAAGQAADPAYTMDTLWGYSKSKPAKDPYGSLEKVGTATYTQNEETGEITLFNVIYSK